MKAGEWTLRSRRVVTPSGTRAADVLIRDEVVVDLMPHDTPEADGVILDVGDLAVLPGLVALHREGPGPGDRRWSAAETRSCVAAGVTTLIQLPPRRESDQADPDGPSRRMARAEGRVGVDSGLVVALGRGNAGRVEPWIEEGFLGVEATLGDGPDPSTEADLRAAMPILAELGRPLLVDWGHDAGPGAEGDRFGSSLSAAEFAATRLVIRLCRETRCRVHLIRPSASEALPMIAEARAEGLPLTVATCPAHLGLGIVGVAGGPHASPSGSSRRGVEVGSRLWEALGSGLIDAIDPDPPRPAEAAFGPTLPAVWAEARRLGFTPDHVGRWLSGRVAGVVGLGARKGSIAPGFDADLVVFDPGPTASSDPRAGDQGTEADAPGLLGRVEATILRGTLMHASGQFFEHRRGPVVLRLQETQPILGTDA